MGRDGRDDVKLYFRYYYRSHDMTDDGRTGDGEGVVG